MRDWKTRRLAGCLIIAVPFACSGCLGGLLPASESAMNVETRKAQSASEGNVAARELLVISQLKNIKKAEDFYFGKHDTYGTLDELVEEGLFNQPGNSMGYDVDVTVGEDGATYELSATPRTYGPNGKRSFFMDEGGTVRGADHSGASADADDPAV